MASKLKFEITEVKHQEIFQNCLIGTSISKAEKFKSFEKVFEEV